MIFDVVYYRFHPLV